MEAFDGGQERACDLVPRARWLPHQRAIPEDVVDAFKVCIGVHELGATESAREIGSTHSIQKHGSSHGSSHVPFGAAKNAAGDGSEVNIQHT